MSSGKIGDLHNLAEADMIIKGGKALPIGTKRTHGGVEVQKTAKGWTPVKKEGGKSTTKADPKGSDTYFKTLSGALDQVRAEAKKHGFTVDEDDIFNNFGTGGISYGTTKSANISLQKDGKPITGKSGKVMNRSIHVSLYRMDSGKYELTAYKTW
tara:strand:- start:101165 stop:101629 length:465 start_codon:yes stop_codon:yes gene_type:complete